MGGFIAFLSLQGSIPNPDAVGRDPQREAGSRVSMLLGRWALARGSPSLGLSFPVCKMNVVGQRRQRVLPALGAFLEIGWYTPAGRGIPSPPFLEKHRGERGVALWPPQSAGLAPPGRRPSRGGGAGPRSAGRGSALRRRAHTLPAHTPLPGGALVFALGPGAGAPAAAAAVSGR